jgi:thiol:disulfide interchange protein DsbC
MKTMKTNVMSFSKTNEMSFTKTNVLSLNKKIPVLSLPKWIALLLLATISAAHAGEAEIRQSLQSKFPNIGKLEHIVKTPYAGLYEVVAGDQLLYTDELGIYLFDGSIIDTKSRTDLTEKRRHQLFAIDFDKLPLELAVKKVKGNGQRKMAYFADPNCVYCKKLEKELNRVNNVTLYLFMYPIFPGSEEIVHNIRCAKDPLKAWEDKMLKDIQPASATCKLSSDKVIALAKKLRVNGTPNLIFADGTQAPGYLPAEELEKRLSDASRK